MIQTRSHSLLGLMSPCFRAAFGFLLLGCLMAGAVTKLTAAETVVAPDTAAFPSATNPAVFIQSNTVPHFSVIGYTVEGDPLLSTNVLVAIFSKYSGTNVSLASIAKAAADLQSEYFHQGYTNMSVAIDRNQIINGIVTMNVFQTVIPQIVVSGIRYISSTNNGEVDWNPLIAESTTGPIFLAASTATTNAIPAAAKAIPPVIHLQATPANPEEMAQARAALFQGMADAAAREKDTRVHVVSTNTGPRFDVEKYLIQGNTVLPPLVLGEVLTNIDGVYGTNVSFDGVRAVLAELQGAYRERGYVTVGVGLPQQKLTNATVKVAVTEGRLANINVTGNHYFSSNNVMRALPSLHTYLILNSLVFGAELNRANANQDRQIYPVIGPGPEPGTSDLTLKVKDRLPLHAKVELNNESSPGTPDLRINASAMEANLWQLEHSLGVQYSFSPGSYKRDTQPWNFYDEPLVANYSAFYRLPLGNPQSIEDVVVNNPGSFGYSEATRQFRLPPPTGRTDLNVYASRSTVDTGLLTPLSESVADIPGFLSISRQDVQEQITVNNDIGSRLSTPAIATTDFQSGFSGGLDYKTYNLTSYKTNTFFFTITTVNPDTGQKTTTKSTVASPAPTPVQEVQYLPLALSYDGAYHNPDVTVGFGLGLSANPWYSGSSSNLQIITGSRESSGYWVKLNPNLAVDIVDYTNWLLSVHANGQWASEPLISTEQYGAGGVNSVRGYHEGEVFGDTGWRFSIEQQTPPHVVGFVYGRTPLTIRGTVYMDHANTYLLDPKGRANYITLWSTGFGLAASVGSHWESRLLFSLPLVSSGTTVRDVPVFNFALTAQF